MDIVLYFLMVVMAFCMYMMGRNLWVHKIQTEFIKEVHTQRLKVIEDVVNDRKNGKISNDSFMDECDKRYQSWDSYEKYNTMMIRFWIWDKEKFRIKN